MVYLIVPPIIIILAFAILIVFLTRVLSSKKRDSSKGHVVLKNVEEVDIRKKIKKGKRFLRKKSDTATKKIKRTLKSKKKSDSVDANNNGKVMIPGIVTGGGVDKVVTLRKKSMVSDRIADGEGRDVIEVDMMKGIEKEPQNSKKYESLADYYMEHEKFEDARECYKYVLRLDPRHKRAQVAMKNLDRVL